MGKNIDYKIHKQISDETGNYIILDITVNNQRFTLVTLYGPNSDNTAFYENIFKHIDEIGNSDFTICGDYNLVLDPNMDSYNYKHVNNPKARDKLLGKIYEKTL